MYLQTEQQLRDALQEAQAQIDALGIELAALRKTDPKLAARCKLATDCLPKSEYRTRLEALHAELLGRHNVGAKLETTAPAQN